MQQQQHHKNILSNIDPHAHGKWNSVGFMFHMETEMLCTPKITGEVMARKKNENFKKKKKNNQDGFFFSSFPLNRVGEFSSPTWPQQNDRWKCFCTLRFSSTPLIWSDC